MQALKSSSSCLHVTCKNWEELFSLPVTPKFRAWKSKEIIAWARARLRPSWPVLTSLLTPSFISANASALTCCTLLFQDWPSLRQNCQLCRSGPNDLGSCVPRTNKSGVGIQNQNQTDTPSVRGDLSEIWTQVSWRLKASSLIHCTTWPLGGGCLSKKASFTTAVYAFWMQSKSIIHQPKHTFK